MRKITAQAINAFNTGKAFKSGNTEVSRNIRSTLLYLHGNLIAEKWDNGKIAITNAGWATSTTKERLNGIPGVNINQKNYQWFLNDKPWNGEWTTI